MVNPHPTRILRIASTISSRKVLGIFLGIAFGWLSACPGADWVTVYRVPTRSENLRGAEGIQPASPPARHQALPQAPSPGELVSTAQVSSPTPTRTGIENPSLLRLPRADSAGSYPPTNDRGAVIPHSVRASHIKASTQLVQPPATYQGPVLYSPKVANSPVTQEGQRLVRTSAGLTPRQVPGGAVGVAFITDGKPDGTISGVIPPASVESDQLEDPGYSFHSENGSQPFLAEGSTAEGTPPGNGAGDGKDPGADRPSDELRPPRPLPKLPDLVSSPPESLSGENGTVTQRAPGGQLSSPQGRLCHFPNSATPNADGPQPWKLIDGPCLQAWRISVGGWLEQGITFNAQEPSSRFNGPVATNDRHADYQLNQLWAYIVRPTKTDGCGFDIGGRVDMVFGTDWRFGINRGLEDRINGLDQYYGLVLPQFYLEVAVNYLTVKLGHFAAILDYEAVPAILNPFYSHSYSYGYTVPQLVTGLLASYQLTEQWSIDAGFHRGWMMFEDNNENLDFMGGVRWKAPSGRTELAYAVSVGPQDDAGQQDRFVSSLVLRHRFSPRLQYVLVHNLGWENDAVVWAQQGPRDAEWYGINQYFIYTISPKLSAATRIEWLRDDDGVRIAGVGNLVPGKGWPALPGFAGNFYELTLGLNWRPHPNVLVRPEARWDWYDGTRNLAGELPFDDGSSDHQFTFATDMIVTF